MTKKTDVIDTTQSDGVAASAEAASAAVEAVQSAAPGPGSWIYDPATGTHTPNDDAARAFLTGH
jgi:hypothetical protein